MPELHIEAKHVREGIAHIEASGTLTGETSEKMEQSFQNLYNRGYYKIIANLTKIKYISSAGAGVFIGQIPKAEEHGGSIFLVMEKDSLVYNVFDILGLLDVFPTGSSFEEGVAHFKKQS